MKELNYESPTLEIICMEAQHCFATSGPVSNQAGLDDLNEVSNVQKITSAENLQSRASDEIVPFREFIIKGDTSALL